MKKLLLAVLVLAGIALPVMAKNCEEDYYVRNDLPRNEKIFHVLNHVFKENDLECLGYYVDEKNFNLNEIRTPQNRSLISFIFNAKTVKAEILSFVINHGITLESKDMNYIAAFLKVNSYDEYDLFSKKFQILLNKYPDAWKEIDDVFVGFIAENAVWSNVPALTAKLLLDNNLPISEYNRYIKAIKKVIEFLEKEKNNWDTNITERIKGAEEMLALFEQSKEAKMQAADESVKKGLNMILEEQLNKNLPNTEEMNTLRELGMEIGE